MEINTFEPNSMLIAIPKIVNYIQIEYDGSIWVNRYDPALKDSQPRIMAKIGGKFKPRTIKLIDSIDSVTRFLNKNLEVVTIDGRDYKELILKTYLTKKEKK